MTAKLITDNFVALVITDSELLEIEDIRKIIDELLENEGYAPWRDMELELFDNNDETLVIARRYASMTDAFCFLDFENLLSAVQNCSATTDSCLVAYKGAYYLMLSHSAKSDISVLGEFCDQSYVDSCYLAHLREHGKTLIGAIAIAKLQKIFVKHF